MTAILKLLRRVFLIVLILSILLIISLALFPSYFFPLQSYPPPPSADLAPEIAIFVSISTAVISFLGFVTTTIISLRRELREARASELELKKKELELEKARLELEQLKRERKSKSK